MIWHDKPVLRELYSDFYHRMADACRPGTTLEIGGGSGNFKEFAPHVVSTDVLFAPWLDSVCDANQAVPTLMFLRQRERFMEKFPGFNLYAVRRCGLFAAPLSGGFRKWSLIPARAVPIINRIEKILDPVLGPLAAFRMLVILERRPD